MSVHEPGNLLVTGGAGFIGANFLHVVLASDPNVNVVTLDKLTYAANLENLAGLPEQRHTFVQGDICDAELVAGLLREHRIDTVVHFAAESHVDRSIDGPATFIQTNIVGTFNLLEQVRQYWLTDKALGDRSVRFHHVSTDEVYGTLELQDPAFTECTRYDPRSPYSASKASSDHLVRAYGHTYGLNITISNCSNNYGPYQHSEKFIPVVIRSCLEGRPIPVYGDGSNIRDWLFVEDHCRALDLVLRRAASGETINIGGNDEQANIDVARRICRAMDEIRPRDTPHEDLITFVTDRPGHDWRYAVDTAHIMDSYGWEPAQTFETGIVETIRWYLEQWG